MSAPVRTEYGLMDSVAVSADRVGDTYVLPASLAQDRFWALDHLDPGNPAWNLAVRFALRGAVDPGILERSIQEIVRRHEVLRTNLTIVDGRVSQVIAPSMPLVLPVEDLRELPEADRVGAMDSFCLAEAHQRFDLTSGPLLRVRLLRVDDKDYVMTVTTHQAIADYWSIGVVAKELGELYTAYCRGLEPRMAPLAIQYGDYAIWQQNRLQDPQVQDELVYWKDQLARLPVAQLPTDHPRSANPTYNSEIVSELLPVELTNSLEEIASQEGATYFQITLAALALALCHQTGQSRFGVATQVAGRDSLEVEPLVGLFIDTIILRMDVSGDPSFLALLHRVRDTATASLANQNLRFEQLLREIQPEVYPSHHALCPLNFICQRDAVKPVEFSGITLTTIPSKSQGAPYELNVFLVMRTEGWRLSCEYNSDLYNPDTVRRLLDSYRITLEQVAINPLRRISEIYTSSVPAKSGLAINLQPAIDVITVDNPEVPGATASESEVVTVSRGAALTNAFSAESSPSETYAIPITINQQRFWLLDQLMPGNPTLNMAAALRLHGKLDDVILRRSLSELSRRHEMLRTTFSVVDGQAVQIIHQTMDLSLNIADLREVPECTREDAAQKLIHAEALAPFNLSTGALFRTGLIRLDTDDHVLMLTMPHIICDGWSNGIIVRELAELYEAYSQGRGSPLEDIRIDYGDFAHWQHEWLKGAVFEEDLSYWKEKLQGKLPLLDLPSDRPRQTGLVSAGSAETMTLSAEFAASLKEFCRREEITMFMLFLSVFDVMLNRYSGQEDILVGSPVAGRTPETESIVGPFSFPISLRIELTDEPTFRELAHRVREATVEALSHKDLPFGRLANELQVEQVQGRNPLFQVYFLHQVAFLQPLRTANLSWIPFAWESPGTAFDLHLATLERGDEIIARLEYNSEMFDASTAQRMLSHFQSIVEAVVERPELRIAEIPLLGTAEAQIIAAAGRTVADESSNTISVLELFLDRTQRTPNAIAVFGESGGLSYRELEILSNNLAERLSKLELGSDRIIGICTDVTSEMVVGAVAALKAKATFAWISPPLIKDRFLRQLATGGMKTVATNDRLRKSFLNDDLTFVSLDEERGGEGVTSSVPFSKPGANTLACVQFTSGSSGGPKPVLLTHSALSIRALAVAESYNLSDEDRVAIVDSGAANDAMFASLIRGSAITVVPERIFESDANLVRFVKEERCTALVLPTRIWQRLSLRGADSPSVFSAPIRLVVVHGDRPAAAAVAAFRRLTEDRVRCISTYGTAEVGSNVAVYELAAGERSSAIEPVVSLGIASAGATIRLLDRHLQPVPIGATGEICVESSAIGCGYLNEPELTAANLQPVPAGAGRLFRTGDLGRYLPDGRIEFLGPPSRHLNLGGYRLHLGELEAALTQDLAVKEALAISTPPLGRDQQAIVYVELESGMATGANPLRDSISSNDYGAWLKRPSRGILTWQRSLRWIGWCSTTMGMPSWHRFRRSEQIGRNITAL